MNSVIQVIIVHCSMIDIVPVSWITTNDNLTILQCLSNTKPLMNYLVQDDYSREINTSSSSMKGSLVKGDTKNTQKNTNKNIISSLCNCHQGVMEGQWTGGWSLKSKGRHPKVRPEVLWLQPGGLAGVPEVPAGGAPRGCQQSYHETCPHQHGDWHFIKVSKCSE